MKFIFGFKDKAHQSQGLCSAPASMCFSTISKVISGLYDKKRVSKLHETQFKDNICNDNNGQKN